MKYLYSDLSKLALLCALLVLSYLPSSGQCPNGQPSGSTAYDTTISFPAGVTSMQVKFPKFNPVNGMVTCMRLCITVGGVVDSLSFENTDISNPHTFTASYGRTDILTGPGVSGMFSSLTKNYSFSLDASTGIDGQGDDFGKVTHDTIVGSRICHTVTSESDLTQFYGPPNDSVVYNYLITGGVNISSSSNASIGIATSGFVRINFQYCTCPSIVLPLNIQEFFLNKTKPAEADLVWRGFDDANADYYYQAEVSIDGHEFRSIGRVNKNPNGSGSYKLPYTANRTGMHFFRIRQVYRNGYTRFSEVRFMNLENSGFPKFSLYPNPSNGIIGIKFANFVDGHLDVKVYNAQGQTVLMKDIEATALSTLQLGSIKQKGVYFVRVMDVDSKQSSVSQVLIK